MSMIPFYETAAPPKPIDFSAYVPTLGESMSTSFGSAFGYNPSVAYLQMPDIAGEQYFDGAYSTTTSDADIVNAISAGEPTQYARPAALSLEEQQERIDEAGLAGIVRPDPAYSEKALATIIDARRLERSRSLASRNAPGWHLPFSLFAALAAGFTDPVNIATAFIPFLGAAEIAQGLGIAGRAAGVASRAASGAIAGGASSALLEPAIAGGQMHLQTEYGPLNSLLNISMGAIIGGAIQPVAGHVSDFLAMRNGKEAPFWMFAPKTGETRALEAGLARQIESVRNSARPGQNAEEVHAQAVKDAGLVDAQIRYIMQQEQLGVAEAYARKSFEIRDGEAVSREVAAAEREVEAAAAELKRLASAGEPTWEVGLAHARARLNLKEARQSLEQQIAELKNGKTLFMRDRVIDNAKLDPDTLRSSPELIARFEALEPVDMGSVPMETLVNKDLAHREQLKQEAISWTRQNYPDKSVVFNQNMNRDVIFDGPKVRTALSHGRAPLKSLLVPHLPELIRTAIKIGEHPDKIGELTKRTVVNSHFLANRFKLNDEEFVVGIILREDANGLLYYDHELARIIKPAPVSTGPAGTTALGAGHPKASGAGALMEITRALLGVKDKTGPTLFQRSATGEIQGAYTPGDPSVIRIFAGHTEETVGHEITHWTLDTLADMAQRPGASAEVKAQWRGIERRFGVEPGGEWSVAQMEAFARDFRLTGAGSDAPPLYRVARQKLGALYAEADAADVPMTRAARHELGELLVTGVEEGQARFQLALADINTRRWERVFTDEPLPAGREAGGLEELKTAVARASEQTEAALAREAQLAPEHVQAIAEERKALLAEADRELEAIGEQQKLLEDFLACVL